MNIAIPRKNFKNNYYNNIFDVCSLKKGIQTRKTCRTRIDKVLIRY